MALIRGGPLGPLLLDPRWLVPPALAGYVVAMTQTWNFPDSHGIPFSPLFLVAVAMVLVAWRWRTGALGPIAAAAIVALTAMALTDVTSLVTQGWRDIGIYLKAGDRWLHGLQVYSLRPLDASPIDLSNYPFLYPPLTLPLFAALSLLPYPLAVALWASASAAAFVYGLRRVGVGWGWCLLLFMWPPLLQGMWVGNVAVPLFLFLAIAPWRPAALAVGPVFKLYSGIAGLWLLRREHWHSLAVAVLGVLVVVVLTLPLVGIDRWVEWLAGLEAYQSSQHLLSSLYGFGLARYLPWVVFLAIAGIVVLLALRTSDRLDQLARLGVATVTGSPSLFSHGFLLALPAMLRLDTPWLWLVLGLSGAAPGPAWFGALAIVVVAWFTPSMRKRPLADPWHPLGSAAGPWPAPDDPARPVAPAAS